MTRLACVVVLLLLVGACAPMPQREMATAVAALDPATQTSERLIIAAVDSRPEVFLGRAGSTPRGYDAVASYGPSAAAVKVMRALEKQYDLREVTAWPIAPLNMHCAVLEVPVGTDPNSLLTELAHDERIKLAQPLQTFATRSESYNDPYVGLQHGFQTMDVADAHAYSRGEGVRIAVIDTGADVRHPDLRGNVAAVDNFVDGDERRFMSDRHGTEVAGVIAAMANNGLGIVGVAPAARLLVYKACWQLTADADPASCNSFTLARALTAALDANAQVVNLSLSGPPDPLLSQLIEVGQRRGIVFVGAVGKGAAAAGTLMQQPGIISVASAGTPSADASLFAPGSEILTLLPGGRFDFASGSSMATAQVSGVVALLLARNKNLTPDALARLLKDTSLPRSMGVADSGIDACAAVTAMVGRGVCLPLDAREPDRGVNTTQRVALH